MDRAVRLLLDRERHVSQTTRESSVERDDCLSLYRDRHTAQRENLWNNIQTNSRRTQNRNDPTIYIGSPLLFFNTALKWNAESKGIR